MIATMRCRSILWRWRSLRISPSIMGFTELRSPNVQRQAKKIRMKSSNNHCVLACHATLQERCLHTSRITCKSHSESSSSLFLTPGFQPSKISGDNLGFYQGSTFYSEKPPGCLPILDASVILNPGKFCKRSSWKVHSPLNEKSHPAIHAPRKQGSISGIEAAQRLVDARREFRELMYHELRDLNRPSEGSLDIDDNTVRKIYALKGHGVPQGLLQQMVEVGREWMRTTDSKSATSAKLSARKISLTNIPGSTLLDTSSIRVTNAKGKTFTVSAATTISTTNQNKQISNPASTTTRTSAPLSPFRNDEDWERNLEMYMVVMNRIGSRMAFVGLDDGLKNGENSDASDGFGKPGETLGNDSIVTPARLHQWDVTITKGESLPTSLLPPSLTKRVSAMGKDAVEGPDPILTVEWIPKGKESCIVVIRLQDEGFGLGAKSDFGSGASVAELDPISLVFRGVYIPSNQ
mmetsp:Transcript_28918/g.58991  ORF Transcript_28918/g.58991 Transcript_28918/m.58991 type:complete len:464 (+) Transcript_28918:158-1549(+)